MFLTGSICFLCKTSEEIRDPTNAVKVKILLSGQDDCQQKGGKYTSHVPVLASTWRE